MDIRVIKKEIRGRITQKRDGLGKKELEEKSLAVFNNFFLLPELENADSVFIFVSFRSEVMTGPIIEQLLKKNKKVIVPYTDIKNKRLLLFYIQGLDELRKGSYGIMEPDPSAATLASIADIDLAVIPGSAFDEQGGRMGYGGGFYDRLMPQLKSGVSRVALAFELQIIDHVPLGYYDRTVDIIVTEERIIRVPKRDRK